MNGELFEASGGALWEVVWGDDMEGLEGPPVDDPPDLSPVKRTRGAWLLVPLAEDCTLVEHFNWSEPGGFVGMMQGLVLGRALREYRTTPAGPPFVRPDGSPLVPPAAVGPDE
jgi:hypothetical protein